RVARMTHVARHEDEFVYPSKGEHDPKGILAQGFGIHTHATGPVQDVEGVLSGAWANFAPSHSWHPAQRAVNLDGDQRRATMQDRLGRELETWVLGFGEHAIVARPERLAETVAKRLKDAAVLYEAAGSSRPPLAKARREPSPPISKRGAR